MKNKNFFKINIIYFVALMLVAIVFVLGYTGILQNEFLTSFIIQIVVMFAVPLLMYKLLMKKSLKETFTDCGFKKISAKMVAISIILGFVLYFINSFVADAFYGIISLFGYESLSSSTTTTLNYGKFLKELILSCVLPGFCEEFLHRGILLHAGKKHTNTKFCLLISSILFGLTHLNIRQFFYAAILGFLMGLVTLVADSIIPSIIIHFMNNFLSNYFFYGTYLDWPVAKFFNFVTNLFISDIFVYILTSSIAVILLILLYNYLLKCLMRERAKHDIQQIVKSLQLEKLSIIQAQIQFNQINQLLKHKHIQEQNKPKPCFSSNLFLISSMVLGIMVTISSFIWGVI
ncbi:MAG: CPBP family intramembrane metalloprotease [Clostridia bacterium]|nr:CPBP family intramembrane metalloprotease [Clostridia bacterium]